MKKVLFVFLAMALVVSVMASQEEVVKQLLPDPGIKAQSLTLTAADVAKVQASLGNKMPVRTAYETYISKTGAVVIEEQMGKWGIIKMAILIDTATKKVKTISIISMQEKRGAGIKNSAFISQFAGKGPGDEYDIGHGIRAISGATISSRAVLIAVKRALIIYDMFMTKSKK
jgi:Na+-translocating ferredoxin:NAD+ oxidoreductase RnfG subunit